MPDPVHTKRGRVRGFSFRAQGRYGTFLMMTLQGCTRLKFWYARLPTTSDTLCIA